MRILIWKYLVNSPIGVNYRPNYFQAPVYRDFINISNIVYKDYPLYKESYYDPDDGINGLNSGYKVLVFSMHQPERSAWANQDLYTFLFSNGTPVKEPSFLFLIEEDGNWRAGTAGIDDIEVDKMWGEKSIFVELKPIETEATDYLASINLTQMDWEYPKLDDYFTDHHFKDVGNLLTFKNEIADIHDRVGDEVAVSADQQRGMWEGGINKGYSVWEGTKSLIKFLGCRFRVDVKLPLSGNYPKFDFVLYWRSAGSNVIPDLVHKPVKEKYVYHGYKNIFIATADQSNPNPPHAQLCKGIVIMKDRVFVYEQDDTEAFRFNEDAQSGLTFNTYPGTLTLKSGDFTRLEIPFHANTWRQITYPNTVYAHVLFQRSDPAKLKNRDILLKCTAVEYKTQLSSISKRFEAESYYTPRLRVGSLAQIENVECVCEEIIESSRTKKLQKAYWIEK